MKYLVLFLVVVSLVACSKKTTYLKDADFGDAEEIVQEEKVVQYFADEPVQVLKETVSVKKTIDIVIDEMIYFGFDQATITEESKQVLDGIINTIYEADNDVQIAVSGYCCPIGTDMYNYNLGQLRADAVKGYIEDRRPGSNINTASFGENNLISHNVDEYWKNRRCEIMTR